MTIPTEPIGSIPRPRELIAAITRKGEDDPSLESLYARSVRDTVERFEATGSPVVTDGEQRKYHNFWTYPVEGLTNTRPDGFRNIRLVRLLDPAAGPVTGDPNRLQHIIWNLLSNAIKFTGRNGRVEVRLERVRSHVAISVADTGIGIAPEFLPHVFDQFRQADASPTRAAMGLGLGLSIVKNLVELHGGAVRVSSPGLDRGTIFTVSLPLTVVHRVSEEGERGEPTRPSAPASDFRRVDLAGIKVLTVDDQADARELLRRVLSESAADVLTASTADEAVRLVESERPDVLVSDIGMPDVDGYELLRRVRALGPARGGRLPAIALTALARSEDRTRALHAGFVAHVSKPVESSELVATVASVVGRTGGG